MKKIKLIFFGVIIFSIVILFYIEIIRQKEVILLGKLVYIDAVSIYEENEDNFIKTNVKNIGVITCTDLNSGNFVALAHDINNRNDLNGVCYVAKYNSININDKISSGTIIAEKDTNIEYGKLNSDTYNGIYGEYSYKNDFPKIKIASRFEILTGNAILYLDLDGKGPKKYQIEIEEIDYLSKSRNLKIKILDNELINKTNGIARGMSGTPIIQNNKLIGAINYVCESNPKIGYAIFADKFF